MLYSLSFNTIEKLSNEVIQNFVRYYFDRNNFLWIEGTYEFIMEQNNKFDTEHTYIIEEESEKGYKFHYTIYDLTIKSQTIVEEIRKLKTLSEKENKNILISDDEINPRTFILIEPNGQCSGVEIENDDYLIVTDYYNFNLGDFRSKKELNNSELDELKHLITPFYEKVEIYKYNDGPIFNGNFNKIKQTHSQLRDFDIHYQISPVGKSNWIDRKTKSKIFIEIMSKFYRIIQKEIIVFPVNFCTIISENGKPFTKEICILITKNKTEEITYTFRENK